MCSSLFCPNLNERPTIKGVFSVLALTLTKGHPQRMSFFIFALTLTKGQPQRVFFSIFFHNPNHRPTTKRVLFYIFVLTKGLPKSMLFYIFAPTLTIGLPQRMSFSIIALTWTKGLPQKRAVLYIWPNQRSPKKCAFSIFLYTKGIFLHFCPYMNQRVLIYILLYP